MSTKIRISNTDLANQIRARLPISYRDRIPKATQSDIASTVKAIKEYDPQWNDSIEVLLNDVVLTIFRNASYRNPLRPFKRAGVFTNGSWIQEIGVGLLKAHQYDKTATNVFGLEEPDVAVNYHKQNSKLKWEISTSPDILEQALLGGEGSGQGMVNSMLLQPTNSAEWDDYLQMRQLFKMYQDNDGFFNVHVPDLLAAKPEDKEAWGKEIAEKIRRINLEITGFYRTQYNAEHLPTFTRRTVLFGTPAFFASFDVNVLAAAFNMDRAQFTADRQVVIDDFGIDKSFAFLADEDLFVAATTKLKTASMYNPDNDYTKTWLHKWGIYSMSRFVNAIRFSTDPDTTTQTKASTVSSVSIDFAKDRNSQKPEFATRGDFTKLSATVTGEGNPSDAVVWLITGTSGSPKSTNTYLNGDGALHVGTDEKNAWIVVQAQSMDDSSKIATFKVGIDAKAPDESSITKVEIDGPATVQAPSESQYSATVTGDDTNRVLWVLGGAPAGVSIDQTGKLTVAATAAKGATFVVMATSQANPAVAGSVTVKTAS